MLCSPRLTSLRHGLWVGVALLAGAAAPAFASPAAGLRGMVASAHPLASEAGASMLRAGGNAVDAAVATAFTLAVVEPFSSGLGGGGFALVRLDKRLVFLDFREVAPAAARRDMFLKDGKGDQTLSRDGALAVAVPGAVLGYLTLQERFGRLKRDQVLQPAIRAAQQGFLVTPRYQDYVGWRLPVLRRDGELSRIFLLPGKDGPEAPPLGYRIVQSDLATTLRILARDGATAFYGGALAQRLVADLKERGGIITLEDLRAFRVRERSPLVGSFLGHAVVTAPPPSAGGEVLLTLLNVMETAPSNLPWHHPDRLHLYIEASKRAFADRALIADPAFVPDLTAQLITKDRAQVIAQLIGEQATAALDIPPGQAAQLPFVPPPRTHWSVNEGTDTTHLCAVDKDGNAVSLTTTVNYGWGAGIVAKGTGVLWNDEMDDFAIAPGVPNVYGVVGQSANAVRPGKIPVSSMTPTLVFEGAQLDSPVRLVVGSPGGPRIPTTVAQVILNYLVDGADIASAVTLGRVHHQHLPDEVSLEPFAIDPTTRRALEERGHRFKVEEPWSNASAIAIDPTSGVRTGTGDPRNEGIAVAE